MKKALSAVIFVLAGCLLYAGVTTIKNYSATEQVNLNSADKFEVRIIPEGTTGYVLLEYTVSGTEKIEPIFFNIHGEIVNE